MAPGRERSPRRPRLVASSADPQVLRVPATKAGRQPRRLARPACRGVRLVGPTTFHLSCLRCGCAAPRPHLRQRQRFIRAARSGTSTCTSPGRTPRSGERLDAVLAEGHAARPRRGAGGVDPHRLARADELRRVRGPSALARWARRAGQTVDHPRFRRIEQYSARNVLHASGCTARTRSTPTSAAGWPRPTRWPPGPPTPQLTSPGVCVGRAWTPVPMIANVRASGLNRALHVIVNWRMLHDPATRG